MEFGVQHKKTDHFRLVLSGVKMIVQIERTAHRTAHEEADVNIVKHLSESITYDKGQKTIQTLINSDYYGYFCGRQHLWGRQ